MVGSCFEQASGFFALRRDQCQSLLSPQSGSHGAPLWENTHATRFEGYLGGFPWHLGGFWGPSWEHFGALGGYLGSLLGPLVGILRASWGQGLAKMRPEDPERPQDTPEEAQRRPQVGAQEGPERPKMHPREVKNDVGNDNDGNLTNDDPRDENA